MYQNYLETQEKSDKNSIEQLNLTAIFLRPVAKQLPSKISLV